MFAQQQEADVTPAVKRKRRDKLAPPTGAEILEKAAREARPTTPAERRKMERAGQLLMPGHTSLPMLAPPGAEASDQG
ncbi:hypothetical protein [Methylobacterium sp. J-092]|uniref:hypothetical protein n=1 Tax=Methylobacterium sp. J-092 TaxID=2836667 RepID=UPI001FBA5FC6|nr:hypothetical protein [Methylobacterium sp. J-092]MCJ2009784.1 hypothetical protein [Methylobacterium sp. J-092]